MITGTGDHAIVQGQAGVVIDERLGVFTYTTPAEAAVRPVRDPAAPVPMVDPHTEQLDQVIAHETRPATMPVTFDEGAPRFGFRPMLGERGELEEATARHDPLQAMETYGNSLNTLRTTPAPWDDELYR